METASERRRRKLTKLCTKYGLKEVATKAGLNPQTLDQIIKGVLLEPAKDGSRRPRSLGDSAAEAIEDAWELGRGWFDNDRASEPHQFSDGGTAIAFIYDKLPPAGKAYLTNTARLLDREARTDEGGVSGLGGVDDLKKRR